MKTKQIAVALCIGRCGGIDNYAYLTSKLDDGWVVNRVDYIYNNAGQPVRAMYILEKEFIDHGEPNI